MNRPQPAGSAPPRRSADRVYQHIRSEIVEGTLGPGDRLLEESLAKRLGVSRTPVREAITRLEADGLVTRAPRRGLVVSSISQQEIEDVYAVREMLEGLTARLCARVASDADRRRFELLEQAMEQAIASRDVPTIFSANRDLHAALARASRNDTLIAYLESIQTTIQRYGPTTMSFPGRAEEATIEHRALIRAIQDHDEGLAERLAREHIRRARDVRVLMHMRRTNGTRGE